ncbi:MAG: hypothetical protein P4L65_06635 [Legionella sp.]|nr:hypothetical protein [Legionella sp.]
MHFNKVKYGAFALTVLSTFNSTVSIAGTMGTAATDSRKGHFIAQIGGYGADQEATQTIRLPQNVFSSRYTVDSSNQGSGLVGVGYFFNGPLLLEHAQLTYGANAFFLGQTSVNGRIVENNLRNFAYRYNIQHLPLYFAAKALINTNYDKFKLALDAGIGPDFMSLSGYREVALNSSIARRPFSDTNQAIFSATAGISIRFSPSPESLPIECGYRFFYFGQGQFDIRSHQANNALQTGNGYANAVVCGVSI